MRNRDAVNPVRIGARVRELRRQRGWQQQELAAAARMQRERLAKLEHGYYLPRLDKLEMVCSALRVPLYVLFVDPPEERL